MLRGYCVVRCTSWPLGWMVTVGVLRWLALGLDGESRGGTEGSHPGRLRSSEGVLWLPPAQHTETTCRPCGDGGKPSPPYLCPPHPPPTQHTPRPPPHPHYPHPPTPRRPAAWAGAGASDEQRGQGAAPSRVRWPEAACAAGAPRRRLGCQGPSVCHLPGESRCVRAWWWWVGVGGLSRGLEKAGWLTRVIAQGPVEVGLHLGRGGGACWGAGGGLPPALPRGICGPTPHPAGCCCPSRRHCDRPPP